MERRVLVVPRGTVNGNLYQAELLGITELEEQDDLDNPFVKVESIVPSVPQRDFRAEFEAAETVGDKIAILAALTLDIRDK